VGRGSLEISDQPQLGYLTDVVYENFTGKFTIKQGFVALVSQSIESVKDFSIATLLWDAELRRNFFDRTGGPSSGQDPFTRAQASFTFGGPIRRDRTHFFFSYERQHVSASTEQHFATPSAASSCRAAATLSVPVSSRPRKSSGRFRT
jgi:hypothetical protein